MTAKTIRERYSPDSISDLEPEILPWTRLELLAEIAAQLAEMNERARD